MASRAIEPGFDMTLMADRAGDVALVGLVGIAVLEIIVLHLQGVGVGMRLFLQRASSRWVAAAHGSLSG